ncbi:MAG: 1,4-dihydroxy-2-naphthoate octaprenyltransferase [Parachlamydiaceae bacterium]
MGKTSKLVNRNLLSMNPDSLAVWIRTIRPKTLTATLIPFCAGAALAYAEGATLLWNLLISALLSGLCIQTATNLINDAFDSIHGADTAERLGPRRAIQQGIATSRQVYLLGLVFFLLAFLIGIPLIAHGGMMIFAILLISSLAGYFYTGGPYPLAYQGLGDLFVIIFFGWVATVASYWLQTGNMNEQSLLLGTQIGLLCTTLIAVNNMRDIYSDAEANKRTFAVRFGLTTARIAFTCMAIVPFGLNFLWLNWNYFYTAFLPFITLPISMLLIVQVWKTYPSKAYNGFLAISALLHLSFGLLLIAGFLLDKQ